MKHKLFAAWLDIPFAAAVALDSSVPCTAIAWVLLAWIVSALVWLERYRRREEQKRQRRFNRMRRAAWEDNHAS